MKIIDYILTLSATLLAGCGAHIDINSESDASPNIYPDYMGVTVPLNIAPLNFTIEDEADDYAVILRYGDISKTLMADDGNVVIPQKLWKEMTLAQAGDSLTVTVCEKRGGEWTSLRPFAILVSSDAIDPTLVYRLIPPLYGTWREIGIYQRDLESYDETPIYENVAYHGNCVNCHTFCAGRPERMLLHLRGPGGATYMIDGSNGSRLDTKTDSTISNFTYPYWHRDGRYVAFSVNDIFQVFHTSDPNRTEVIDEASDIVIYDTMNNEVFSSPLVKSTDRLETFPAFSADGETLYFCSATKPDTLPEKYREVRYSLCSIGFDSSSAALGDKVDTLFNATTASGADVMQGSMSFPRPSPDGRWLVSTLSGYGNFSIWHKDADLWIMDITTRRWRPLTYANSDDVESYHSWSSNSRWMVFSSRRDDGLYTRPYIVHIDDDGSESLPFMLPQKYPKRYYTDEKNSYNIPELVTGQVDVDTRRIVDLIEEPCIKVRYRH